VVCCYNVVAAREKEDCFESHLCRVIFPLCVRDLISRGWRGSAESAEGSNASNGKAFVKRVKLLVIDEIHLVGEERGAVLEAIVSRTRFISRVLKQEENGAADSSDKEATRIIGLSTALENPLDIADWCVLLTGRLLRSIQRKPNLFLQL
jgi:hypothetical protein